MPTNLLSGNGPWGAPCGACRDDLASGLCSAVSRAHDEDPIGSAPSHRRYLLVEVAPPWAGAIDASRRFPPVLRELGAAIAARGIPFRSIAVEPDAEYSRPGHTRAILLYRPDGPFAVYDREEFLVPDDRLGPLVAALFLRPAELPRFAPWRQGGAGVRDLLVCTHGTKDACCGKFGYPLYRTLHDRYAPAAGGRLRVWRASHIGGHRFAPTLVDFPEGRYWAHLTPDALDALVRREGSPAALRRHYRGWGGLDGETKFVQIAEREILAREGWAWIGYRQAGEVLTADERGTRATVRITFSSPDGHRAGAYEATVEAHGNVPLVSCRARDEAPDSLDQYRVTRLVELAAPTTGPAPDAASGERAA